MFNYNLFFNSDFRMTFYKKKTKKYKEADFLLLEFLVGLYKKNGDVNIFFNNYVPKSSVIVVVKSMIKKENEENYIKEIEVENFNYVCLYDQLRNFTFGNIIPRTRSYILDKKVKMDKDYSVYKLIKKFAKKMYVERRD